MSRRREPGIDEFGGCYNPDCKFCNRVYRQAKPKDIEGYLDYLNQLSEEYDKQHPKG